MARKQVAFENLTGERLAGILETPDDRDIRACALFAHCFTCTKNLRAAVNISRALTDQGFAVLRFDFTGLGESEGEFAETSFSTNVSDLLAAAGFLQKLRPGPELLIGHSLGGTAVLMAAPQIDSCRAVVTIGSPARAEHVARHIDGDHEKIRTEGQADVSIGGRPFRIRREFLEDLEGQPVPERAASLRSALLVMHSPVDTVVSVDNATEIFQHARHPKSFISLDRADHLLSQSRDSAYVGDVIASWANRYLPQPDSPTDPPRVEGSVTAVTRAGGFRTSIWADRHRLVADEPASVGGEDAGPTPYGLLSAALASCTSMTLQMYARHKGLRLESARVTVSHEKIHAVDCQDCEAQGGRIDRFERMLALEGELSDQQRRRMVEIAEKCPVHRTLYGAIEVRTSLAD